MMKLYFFPGTRSVRPRWLLEEAGVPYDLTIVNLAKGEHKASDYLKIHPLGSVPALVDGDTTVFDSTAICLYLAEQISDGALAPAPRDRAAYYQWVLFAMTSLEPKIAPVYMRGFRVPIEERAAIATDADRQALSPLLAPLQAHLEGQPFLLQDFSAADVIVGGVLHWGEQVGLFKDHPALTHYVHELRRRPAFLNANS